MAQRSDPTIPQKLAVHGGPACVVDLPSSLLHGPAEIGEEEIAAVTEALRGRNLFRYNRDPATSPVARFEAKFAKAVGVEHALAVNSGTSALICGLIGLGVGSGDEVIVPAYTYIATAAAALAVGAVPVVAEIDESLTLDPDDVVKKITPRTKLICPVHMRGIPCDMKRIMAVADAAGVKVLEDVAQANGGRFGDRALGSIGHAGAFSLQHYKIITAGEGGAFVTNDKTCFDRGACYHDSAYAFWKEREHDLSITPFLGQNYRMSELNGALAEAQLPKRDRILARTRAIKRRITEQLGDLDRLTPAVVPDAAGDCGIVAVFFAESPEYARQFSEALTAEGGTAQTVFNEGVPDRHIYYHWDYVLEKRTPDPTGRPWTDATVAYDRDMCPRSLDLLHRTVALPISQTMSDAHVDSLIRAVRKVHELL